MGQQSHKDQGAMELTGSEAVALKTDNMAGNIPKLLPMELWTTNTTAEDVFWNKWLFKATVDQETWETRLAKNIAKTRLKCWLLKVAAGQES